MIRHANTRNTFATLVAWVLAVALTLAASSRAWNSADTAPSAKESSIGNLVDKGSHFQAMPGNGAKPLPVPLERSLLVLISTFIAWCLHAVALSEVLAVRRTTEFRSPPRRTLVGTIVLRI